MTRGAALVAIGALAACASSSPLVVSISAGNPCTARLNGVVLDAEAFGAALKRLRDKPHAIAFVGPGDVQYRCIGAMIYQAQAAGVRVVRYPMR